MAPPPRVAFLVDQQFEDAELRVPFARLEAAGYQVILVGREAGLTLEGKKGRETVTTTRSIREVTVEEFAALVIPGGHSPERLRRDPQMVRFTRNFVASGKPVAAVCHAGWLLAAAGVLEGRTVTSWPSIRTDLVEAGARWVDREVVEDGNLITSRKPGDLPAFSEAILRQLALQRGSTTWPMKSSAPVAPSRMK